MNPTLALWFALLSPLAAIPANTTLTLVDQPGFNRVSVTVNPGPFLSDTETTNLNGSVQATFDINPTTGQTSELTLTNGRANGTNMTFPSHFWALATTSRLATSPPRLKPSARRAW